MHSLHEELIDILTEKKLNSYFQAIVSLSHRKIIAYEAFIRGPSNSPLHSAGNLFNTAERFNLLPKLELLCQELSMASYANLHLTEKLFININTASLLLPDFNNNRLFELACEHNIDPGSIVIEFTEHTLSDNYDLIRHCVLHYKSQGFGIAIDDLGAGFSGSKLWSELSPEYVKIDKNFIQNIDDDPIKFQFLQSIQDVAISLDCILIAEGIETVDELIAIENIGLSHAQGRYFASPSLVPIARIDSSLFVTENFFSDAELLNAVKPVTDIAKFITPVSPETPISQIMLRFQKNSSLTALPLVENDIATGIIFRDIFFAKLFSSRDGLELYDQQPVKIFIDKLPLSIDENFSIPAVSKKLTATQRHDPAFIITRSGNYAGIVSFMDLLAEITHLQMDSSRHAQPLTLLQGSVPINRRINRLLDKKSSFSVAYFDLDNFRPFNDSYGDAAGDEVIKAVAKILSRNVSGKKGQIGHFGEDCFVAVLTTDDWLACFKAILKSFKKSAPFYYKDRDVKAGGIYTTNRSGQDCFHPLMSMSIGIVDPSSTNHCKSYIEIADLASEAIDEAKKIAGNSLYINKHKTRKGS